MCRKLQESSSSFLWRGNSLLGTMYRNSSRRVISEIYSCINSTMMQHASDSACYGSGVRRLSILKTGRVSRDAAPMTSATASVCVVPLDYCPSSGESLAPFYQLASRTFPLPVAPLSPLNNIQAKGHP